MFKENDREVNRIIARILLFASALFFLLLLLNVIGLYDFGGKLELRLLISAVIMLVPAALIRTKVNQDVVKYATLITMIVIISTVGSSSEIGIYITYVLVPVVSCLYFDKRLVLLISGLMFVAMLVALWFNTGTRYEVTLMGLEHAYVFVQYAVGFTIEFSIMSLVMYQLASRTSSMMEREHDNLLQLQTESRLHQLMMSSTRDIIAEYSVKEDRYKANRSLYPMRKDANLPVDILACSFQEQQNTALKRPINKIIKDCTRHPEGIYGEYNFSYTRGGKRTVLWYQVEGFGVKDVTGQVTSLIFKFHDITSAKLLNEQLRKKKSKYHYVSGVEETVQRRSLVDSLKDQPADTYTTDDLNRLTEGHQFIVQMMDKLRYAKDLDKELVEVLQKAGIYFGVDRLCMVEIDAEQTEMKISYQWNLDPSNEITGYFSSLSESQRNAVSAAYDRFGFMEFNPSAGIGVDSYEIEHEVDSTVLNDILLGDQLWIPTLLDGEYNGALFFDKFDTTPYSTVDRTLMAEFVSTFSAYITKLNAERSNKAKSAYLSNMSHEIRTPMNAILGMTEIALKEEMSEAARKDLKIIKSSAKGLLAIINDILDFSKIESGRFDIVPESYSTLSLFNDIKTIADTRNIDKKLDLIFDVDSSIPTTLSGDAGRIKQVMVNLINNAIKFTDKGSVTVSISFEAHPLNDKTGVLTCRVQDTGQGIKQEDMTHLFQSFSQVNKKKNHKLEGTGLGLAISKQLVELMNGSINVESTYGEGSCFYFKLPQDIIDAQPAGRLEDHAEYADASQPQSLMFEAPNARMLIADDSEINRLIAVELLKPIGCTIDEASNGEEALEKTRKYKYDVILMDNFMPIMDGEETTIALRNEKGNKNVQTPVIAFTADAVSGVKEKLFAAGMNDFLSKPMDPLTTYKKLKKYLYKEPKKVRKH